MTGGSHLGTSKLDLSDHCVCVCVCDCVCVRACAFPWFWKGCSEVTAWFGNYEVRIGHWEQRIWKLFGVQVPRNIISPTPPHLKRSIMSVFKCQGTLLAHPTSPHVPSCWCASAKEPHPTPAHRTSIPCTTSKYTIAKIDNPSRAASQPIATKKKKQIVPPLSMNVWSIILEP